MNMDELTKSQIVLLTLLVSFVTSIATGIVTVALLGQAPPAITQSVSRIIRETVQTVGPASLSQRPAATQTREKTVVVNESDLKSKAVERASASLVRVMQSAADGPVFLGLGVVLDSEGMIATDSESLQESADVSVLLPNGLSVRSFVRARDAKTGIAYLLPATTTPAAQFFPISISTNHVVLGQTVIALGGKTQPRIASGLIASLASLGEASTSPRVIETNIASETTLPGALLIDTQGILLGINTSGGGSASGANFISASALRRPVLK